MIDEPPWEDRELSGETPVETPVVCGPDEDATGELFVVNESDVMLPTEGVPVTTDDRLPRLSEEAKPDGVFVIPPVSDAPVTVTLVTELVAGCVVKTKPELVSMLLVTEELARELTKLLIVPSVGTVRLPPLLVTGSDDVAAMDEFPSVRLPVAETLLSDMLLMDVGDDETVRPDVGVGSEPPLLSVDIELEIPVVSELRGLVSVSGTLEPATEDSETLPVAGPASAEVTIVSLGYIVSVNITLDDKVTIVIISDVGLAEVIII